jgi:hypothetical protein
MSLEQRQQRALRDPWDDSLFGAADPHERRGAADLDDSNLRKDIDHVLNP